VRAWRQGGVLNADEFAVMVRELASVEGITVDALCSWFLEALRDD